MSERFQDETVFVTGAGSGIGQATAVRAASEGATVVVADVDADGGTETVDRIEDNGGTARFRELDVRDAGAFAAAVDETAEEEGLDVLVNNAGIGHEPTALEDTDPETFERVLDVNVRGVWNGCHAAVPHLKAQGSGAVVNVASLAAIIGLPMQAAYSLSKGAVLNFTRAVAAETGPHGVRANAVCPGFVDTPLIEGFFEGRDDPAAARERMEGQYPLRRLGEPGEIADAVLFLASDDASWVTGHGLVVDGGYSCQ